MHGSSTNSLGAYLAEAVIIDGTAYGPDSFGETKNGVWIPKNPSSLTFGNNGAYLKFENASDLGNDSSGNNNDFTANNMGTDHQVLDSPTFGSLINMASSGNFCIITLKPFKPNARYILGR